MRYASPEQFGGAAGDGAPDARSDVYSFAVLLYELLTGISPVPGSSADQIIAGHLFRPPRDFAETDPEGRLPEGLRQVLLAALAKDPAERTASAAALRDALRPFRDPNAALDLDLERTLLDATRLVAEPSDEGSSIQRRVDAGFAVDRIPAGATPLPAVEDAAEETSARTRDLLDNARLLLRLEQFDKAERELDRLQVLAPELPEVAELRKVVRRGRQARREAEGRRRERSRREQVDALLEEAQKLAVHDLDQAIQRLEKVLRLDPGHAAARRVLETLSRGAERQRQRQEGGERRHHLDDALRLRQEGDLEGALAAAEAAAQAAVEDEAEESARALRDELSADLEQRRDRERRRAADLEAATASVAKHLVEGISPPRSASSPPRASPTGTSPSLRASASGWRS